MPGVGVGGIGARVGGIGVGVGAAEVAVGNGVAVGGTVGAAHASAAAPCSRLPKPRKPVPG